MSVWEWGNGLERVLEMIDPRDEGIHPSGENPDYQESSFLAWRDSERGVGGNHRVGNEVNRGLANIWCGVYLDDGLRYRLNAEGFPLERVENHPGLRCGPQMFCHDGKRLNFSLLTDDCRVELEITDIPASVHWASKGERTSGLSLVMANHFDCHCVVKGVVNVGRRSFDVNGHGWRDRSWGPRNWAMVRNHRYIGGHFGEDYIFDFHALTFSDGRVVADGRITRGGERELINDIDLIVGVEPDSVTARTAMVRGVTPKKRRFEFRFELADAVVVETREYLGLEGVGEALDSEGRRGFGYFAMSSNPRGGKEFPAVILHAVAKNGLSRR